MTSSNPPPLRNFTEPQWADIFAHLPERASPTHEASIEFLLAANNWWEGHVPLTLRKRATRLNTAINHLRAAKRELDVAAPHMQHHLATDLDALIFHRDVCQLTPNRSSPKKIHDDEFLKAALKFWFACGGGPGTSWSGGKPSGPLIRYLRLVCDLVMGEAAPADGTLRAFAGNERRRRR